MTSMRRFIILGLALLLLGAQHAVGAEEPAKLKSPEIGTDKSVSQIKLPPFTPRVEVRVSADGSPKDLITSYVTRELRDIGGIVIVDSDPLYSIQIVAVDLQTKSGIKTGYALSSVVFTFLNPQSVCMLAGVAKDADRTKWLTTFVSGQGQIADHRIQICDTDGLRALCDKLVASFDSEQLEPSRKALQDLQDRMDHPEKQTTPAATK